MRDVMLFWPSVVLFALLYAPCVLFLLYFLRTSLAWGGGGGNIRLSFFAPFSLLSKPREGLAAVFFGMATITLN